MAINPNHAQGAIIPSRTGQLNKAGDAFELFRDLFSGEVLTEFHKRNIMMGRHRVKTIKGGRSYDFPLVGTAGAGYHTAGSLLQGQTIAHAMRRITVDELVVAPVFIDRLDEALTEFDVRSIYTKEVGKTLADLADRNILRTAAKAAAIDNKAKAEAAGLGVLDGETFVGNTTVSATYRSAVTGQMIYDAILKLREERDKKGIYDDGLTLYLAPDMFYRLLNAKNIHEVPWMNRDVGGSVDVNVNSPSLEVAGVTVMMTPNLPFSDESVKLTHGDPTSARRPDAYKGDYAGLVGVLMNSDAVATVKVFDLAVEGQYQIERQGHLIVAKYAMGHNVLRHQMAQGIYLSSAAEKSSK